MTSVVGGGGDQRNDRNAAQADPGQLTAEMLDMLGDLHRADTAGGKIGHQAGDSPFLVADIEVISANFM